MGFAIEPASTIVRVLSSSSSIDKFPGPCFTVLDIVVNNEATLREAINRLPPGNKNVFMQGGSYGLIMFLNTNSGLLQQLADKGVVNIKVGGLMILDISSRIESLRVEEAA